MAPSQRVVCPEPLLVRSWGESTSVVFAPDSGATVLVKRGAGEVLSAALAATEAGGIELPVSDDVRALIEAGLLAPAR